MFNINIAASASGPASGGGDVVGGTGCGLDEVDGVGAVAD